MLSRLVDLRWFCDESVSGGAAQRGQAHETHDNPWTRFKRAFKRVNITRFVFFTQSN